ncbi:hypothetical protein [Brevibacillus fortis]|uniref:Uncharacterized protein n=1 Tax=Brevibacillus fortis TaxID=2126352 RepID=A0A2P7VIK8_9BACL|nr:hypothetical protein [Brevibacillus fortis]PSJ99035.1 hypothetical protein C7R93_05275 [Brevibacillus fortis]
MKIYATTRFTVESFEMKERIDTVLKSFDIDYTPPGPYIIKGGYIVIDYHLHLQYEPYFVGNLMKELQFVREGKGGELEFMFDFQFTDYEMNDSPLFDMYSIGNIPRRYLTNEGQYNSKIFCQTCEKVYVEKDTPLVINTKTVDQQDFVYVDSRLVISEKIACLFKSSKLTGYLLEQVEHYGSKRKRRPAYEVVPTNILTPQCIPDEYKNDPNVKKLNCPACNTGSHLIFPYHYDQGISKFVEDFNLSFEYTGNEKSAKRNVLISRKVKDLLTENGYVDEEWIFQPIIIKK